MFDGPQPALLPILSQRTLRHYGQFDRHDLAELKALNALVFLESQDVPRFQQMVAAAGLQAQQVGSYRNLASHGSGLRFARVGATAGDWQQAFVTRNLALLMTTIVWFEIVALRRRRAGCRRCCSCWPWPAPRGGRWPAAPAFVPPPAAQPDRSPSGFAAALLPTAAPSAHAAALAELADGRIAAAWFAGTREGAADVAVWFATLGADGWSPPQAIATRAGTAAATRAYVRKVGNPVLYAEGGRSPPVVRQRRARRLGRQFAEPCRFRRYRRQLVAGDRLQTSPFFNISTLGRAPPVALADGGLGLPVYHEFIAKHGEWLRLGADGRIVDKVRMAHAVRTLQPAVAALDERHALAILRDAGPGPGRIRAATSADGGSHWPAAADLPLPNPNSSVALLRLHSGRLLIAGNVAGNRNQLLLWLSDDAGKNWRLARRVESDTDDLVELSYPALLQGRDGRIHLAYTWRRQGIKHAVFSEAWLAGGAPGTLPRSTAGSPTPSSSGRWYRCCRSVQRATSAWRQSRSRCWPESPR